jgi:hypothetical protein
MGGQAQRQMDIRKSAIQQPAGHLSPNRGHQVDNLILHKS